MKKYFSLVLIAHSVFALPFAFIGFFLALKTTDYSFDGWKLLYMVACMVFARNAAMAFNRYLDRDIDALNPRTAVRDIPAGRISAKNALTFTLVNAALFVLTTSLINPLCFYLSPVALLVILGYSYTKRFTPLCHLVLGAGLALAPLGAYLTVTGSFSILPIFYSFAVLFWVSGFDIIYALQDEEFDRKHQLHSIPTLLGTKRALLLSRFLHVLSAIFVTLPLFFISFGWIYLLGLLIYFGLLIYQHTLVSPTNLSKVDRAFMTTNGYASLVFAVCFLLDTWLF